MKKFRVHVNGKAYEVEIEELTGTAAPAAPAPAAPKAPPAPAAPAPAAPAQSAATGDEVITAPMPGKIVSVEVKKGQAVKEGDLILVLEAMKMENEIFCNRAGTVKELRVSANATVNTEDVLAVIG
jgi:glutaconyl-CoA decarboxylase